MRRMSCNAEDEMAAKIEPTDRQSAGAAMGSDDQLNQQILTIVQDLQGVGLQPSHLEEMSRWRGMTFVRVSRLTSTRRLRSARQFMIVS